MRGRPIKRTLRLGHPALREPDLGGDLALAAGRIFLQRVSPGLQNSNDT